jgi:hypothetical protein
MPQLQYVILRHDGIDEPHFDLMFESAPGSSLNTWRSPRWPIDRPTPLVPLGDHRREYLEFEGPVSGNRGHVTRVERGQFNRLAGSEPAFRITLERGIELEISRHGDQWLARPISA